MKIGILGGGVAGAAMAHFLPKGHDITILEREDTVGGLARSHKFLDISYDIGPHIIFSRNKEVLNQMLEWGGDKLTSHSRSNQIWYKGRLVQYPFENDLGALPEAEKEDCLNAFLKNPYREMPADNMSQFFLQKFGSGITNTYLRPYNEKIWKFDPSFLDTQMVERIPQPPDEDVISGARGERKEGYTHQVKFYYPKQGGVQTFLNAVYDKLPDNVEVKTQSGITTLGKQSEGWLVQTEKGEELQFDHVINCMPLHSLFKALEVEVPEEVTGSLAKLKFNSLKYGLAVFKADFAGDNFSFNIPQKDIIFHRVSKVNFIGEENPEHSAFLYEMTYREDHEIARLSDEELKNRVVEGLTRMELVKSEDLVGIELRDIEKAYVIYSLDHRENTDRILNFLKQNEVICCGRFAQHEYQNMDHVFASAMQRAKEFELMSHA